MTAQDQLVVMKQMMARFTILSDWVICVASGEHYQAQVSRSMDKPRAILHPWPFISEPASDFFYHETLHLALTAFERLPHEMRYEGEEQLVRDICKIAREGTWDTTIFPNAH